MRRVVVCVALLSLAWSQTARADEGAARAAFEEGVAALRADRCDEAIAHFERSIEEFDGIAARHNLGLALEECGRILQSVSVLEDLLARIDEGRYGELGPERRAAVSEQLRGSRAQLAILRVEVPSGTSGDVQVSVDGTARGAVRDGRPLREAVDPGQHHISGEGEGGAYEAADRSVGRGEVARITLTPVGVASGRLIVEGEGLIEVEGVGSARDRFDEHVAPGRYEVRVGDEVRNVEVRADGEHRITVSPRRSRAWIGWVIGGVVLAGGITALAVGLSRRESFDFEIAALRPSL